MCYIDKYIFGIIDMNEFIFKYLHICDTIVSVYKWKCILFV